MALFIEARIHTEKEAFCMKMNHLNIAGVFDKEVNIDDPWEPTIPMQNFGVLSGANNQFATFAERRVKCSRRLYAFITTSTTYAHPMNVPNPESAMKALLDACFLHSPMMLKKQHSPYNLLCVSHMCIDVAFVRAVRLASAWLGPELMPVGHISTWPPTSDATGL